MHSLGKMVLCFAYHHDAPRARQTHPRGIKGGGRGHMKDTPAAFHALVCAHSAEIPVVSCDKRATYTEISCYIDHQKC